MVASWTNSLKGASLNVQTAKGDCTAQLDAWLGLCTDSRGRRVGSHYISLHSKMRRKNHRRVFNSLGETLSVGIAPALALSLKSIKRLDTQVIGQAPSAPSRLWIYPTPRYLWYLRQCNPWMKKNVTVSTRQNGAKLYVLFLKHQNVIGVTNKSTLKLFLLSHLWFLISLILHRLWLSVVDSWWCFLYWCHPLTATKHLLSWKNMVFLQHLQPFSVGFRTMTSWSRCPWHGWLWCCRLVTLFLVRSLSVIL